MHAWVPAAVHKKNTSTKGCIERIKSVPALQRTPVHVRGTYHAGKCAFCHLVFQQPLSFYSLCLVKEKNFRTSVVYISKLAELWAACRSAISSFTQTRKSSDVHQPWADLRAVRLSQAVLASPDDRVDAMLLCGCRCIHLVRRLPHIALQKGL